MDIRRLDKKLSVSPQISAGDLVAIYATGFRTLICNRPDGEEPAQPDFEEIETAAKNTGLETRHLPVTSGMVSDKDVAEFEQALRELPGPVFAYCRSGMRSAILWALSQARHKSSSEILGTARAAGYDLGKIEQRIANVANATSNADGFHSMGNAPYIPHEHFSGQFLIRRS
ncbi:uncharacterized protein (TIGR01244 family) [Natronospira proteinivora]|uniref:Uncharacterized protein (TIGR01244 family) n=1 Tax=Natronospira proteinivora TaxID=1807133 RepID=A0ABT1G6W0_9GAMM|nr:TIGR01244 family sulfur transferase [Natronospira proteinivora]MCP1727039.1 uncharacterized protein (TIGR01244 family) [Natronospira proteinivora]